MTDRRIAAIWARVSTQGQMDLSPETQVSEVRPWLEEQGYDVPDERIIKVHWTSQEVLDCPDMKRLLEWVRDGEVQAVGVIHDDRLAGTPGSKVIILEQCERAGVKVLSKNSPLEGWAGEVMGFLNAVNKRNSVNELRRRVKGGLRDRAKLKGLPTTGKPPYGFRYRYDLIDGKKTPVSLEPVSETYPVACRIWRWALEGTPIRRICVNLVSEGIPAPRGGKHWGTNTVHKILKNPIYGGRMFALKYEAKKPKKRMKADTYGNSSQRNRPIEEWEELNFPIETPIVSWAEYQTVQEKLELNKAHPTRTNKWTYLLRGMLFCPEDGRRLAGRGTERRGRREWYYICSRKYRSDDGIPECSKPPLSGPAVESVVWDSVVEFLREPRTFMAEMDRRRSVQATDECEVRDRISALERKVNQVDSMETELVGLKLREQVSEEAFQREGALLRAERTHYRDELGRQELHLVSLSQSSNAIEAMEKVRDRIVDKLAGATDSEKRWVLETLKTRVTVHESEYEISIGVPPYTTEIEAVQTVHQTQI